MDVFVIHGVWRGGKESMSAVFAVLGHRPTKPEAQRISVEQYAMQFDPTDVKRDMQSSLKRPVDDQEVGVEINRQAEMEVRHQWQIEISEMEVMP